VLKMLQLYFEKDYVHGEYSKRARYVGVNRKTYKKYIERIHNSLEKEMPKFFEDGENLVKNYMAGIEQSVKASVRIGCIERGLRKIHYYTE